MASPLRHRRVVLAVQALAVCLLSLHVAHTGFGLGGSADLFDTWLYHGLMLGAAAALLARAALVREDRVAWLVLGAGALSWSAGDLYFTAALADEAVPPMPSVSDGLFLAFYPATWIALGLLVKRHVREFPMSLRIDAVMGALAVGALAVTVLHDTIAVELAGDLGPIVTTLAYPAGDVLVLALVTALLALTGWRPGATWMLIGGALVLGAAGDAAFLYQSAQGTYAEGTLLDSVWPASLLLLAFAAWQPARYTAVPLQGMRILAMPALFATIAMGVFVAGQLSPLSPIALGLACGTIIALVVRMGVTLNENLRILEESRGEALTDALTGLGNRRRLMADLERELLRASAGDPRALVLFDLDGFKAYNDGHGHLAGDAVLARLGARLAAAAEPTGRAYRLGGDEFCVLLRGRSATSPDLHAALADALHEPGEEHTLRSSFGSVLMPAEAATVTRALQLADERMYANKERTKRPDVASVRRSLVTAAVSAAMLLVALPAIASAAEGVAVTGDIATYEAGAGEANTVVTRQLAKHISFQDWTSPLFPIGAGCDLRTLEVHCASTDVGLVRYEVLDRNDTVTHSLDVPALLDGGAGDDKLTGGPLPDQILGGDGNDRIVATDGVRDTIDCGPGVDAVEADPDDVLVGCADEAVQRVVAPVAETAAPPAPVAEEPVKPEKPVKAQTPRAVVTPVVGVVQEVLRVAAGAATLELACPPTEVAGCRGEAYLDPAPASASKAKRRGKGKARKARVRAYMARRGRFGRSPFVIASGKSGKVKVRLSAEARRALGMPGKGKAKAARRGRRIKAVVTVVQRGRRAQRSVVELRG